MIVRRAFVDIEEGQVHYRHAGAGGTPLVMLHVAPGTSRGLAPLVGQLAEGRAVYALDCMGMGDSAPPPAPEPDMAYFADATLRAIDALGLETVDLYGNRGGAHIALEIAAAAAPSRVRRLILDGLWHFPWPENELPWTLEFPIPPFGEIRNDYAPKVEASQEGNQFNKVWHRVRDSWLFWPHYARDGSHARGATLPPADDLHAQTVEILKALSTQHLGVRAAFDHDYAPRCAQVTQPTLAYHHIMPFMPQAQQKTSPRFDNFSVNPKNLRKNGEEIAAFLDAA